jgi:hypothetical protein
MPKKTFALDPGGQARVEIEWRGIWKDVHVRLDGQELGVIPTKKELETGRTFPLPAGGVLSVQLSRSLATVELQVARDGVPLPGSSADPAERVKQAAYMLYIIAALNFGLGVIAELAGLEFLRNLGIGWGSAVEGAVYALLGWRTSKGSRIALGLGMGLFAVDTVWLVIASTQPGRSLPTGGLVARFFFFMPLVKGFKAAGERKAASSVATSGATT